MQISVFFKKRNVTLCMKCKGCAATVWGKFGRVIKRVFLSLFLAIFPISFLCFPLSVLHPLCVRFLDFF